MQPAWLHPDAPRLLDEAARAGMADLLADANDWDPDTAERWLWRHRMRPVTLRFRTTWVEWLGWIATAGAIVLLVTLGVRRRQPPGSG